MLNKKHKCAFCGKLTNYYGKKLNCYICDGNVVKFGGVILNDDGLGKKLLERDYEYQRKMNEYEIKDNKVASSTRVIFW